MDSDYGNISPLEKVEAVMLVARGLLSACYRFVTAPFRGSRGAPTAFHHALYGAVKIHLLYATRPGNAAKVQWLNPYTDQVYLDLCSKRGIVPNTSLTSDGVKGHWLGPQDAKKVFVFFHGGGYVLPPSEAHIAYLARLQQHLEKDGHSVAVVVLAYSLVPKGIFPAQIRQAVSLLRHLIEVEGKDPSEMTIAGDSAGGNLLFNVLSHVLHPLPDVPKLDLSSPFKAAVAISPLVSFNVDGPSYKANEHSDVLNGTIVHNAAVDSMGGKEPSNNAEPARAPAAWWIGLDNVVQNVLLWGGAQEVFCDSIADFGNTIGKVHKNTTTMIIPGAAHEEMIFDEALGYGSRRPAETLEAWIRAKL